MVIHEKDLKVTWDNETNITKIYHKGALVLIINSILKQHAAINYFFNYVYKWGVKMLRVAKKEDFKVGTVLIDSEGNKFGLRRYYIDGIWESNYRIHFESEARFYQVDDNYTRQEIKLKKEEIKPFKGSFHSGDFF